MVEALRDLYGQTRCQINSTTTTCTSISASSFEQNRTQRCRGKASIT